ncbi:AbrB family transcriptional regulator [Jiella sonneratiae]|uniref:AbrB family transcriptional regulator n=1 Tax=Jiella sonneratiae TaxID=2816856 RepID=A0ABS3J8B6_9HYPH|nr:AbrB family transcriptional regulator [Jiella sonneratiae]
MTPRAGLRLSGGLVSAALVGIAFHLLGLPLAWIFGSMLGSAVYANCVPGIGRTHLIRRAGQLLIGSSVASVLDVATIRDVAGYLPAMVAAAVASNAVGVLLALPLARLAGVDRLSALLAALPAGMSEMASLAADLGARADFVMVAHSLRVVLVVLTVPVLIGLDRSGAPLPAGPAGGSVEALVACLLLGSLLAYGASRMNLLNPWIIMPMSVGVALVLAGFQLAAMPSPLLAAAQIAIGFSLGTRLKREDLTRLPRATLAGLAASLALVAAMMVLAAFVMPGLTGLGFSSLALAMAPGGLGEMIATAKALGLASALVASFQFVRSFMTNLLAPLIILKLVGRDRGS